MSKNTNLGRIIILQSGPATGKSLLPRLLLAPLSPCLESKIIRLTENIGAIELHMKVSVAAEDIVIIDEISADNHRGLNSLLEVMARPEMKHIQFILLTQTRLPDEFYAMAHFCWSLTPIYS